jgi:4'-phosphopantetheinyl transferase
MAMTALGAAARRGRGAVYLVARRQPLMPRISESPSERASTDTIRNANPPSTLYALPPPDPAVMLWLCRLDRDPVEVTALARWLSPPEHERSARFGTDLLRWRWTVGRATLRLLLANQLGTEPAAVQLRRGIRGRPEIVSANAPDFNVSHTQDIALIGIGVGLKGIERIGVDIERADRSVNADGLARKFLSERERASLAPLSADARRLRFLRLWTCKEAMSKATGDALSAPFRDIQVALDDGPQLVAGPAPYSPDAWRLIAAEVPEGLLATVAIWRGRD